MVKELDTVVLTHAIKEHGLEGGDIGAVVHCYPEGTAFEVEFLTAEGKTIALLTLDETDVRLELIAQAYGFGYPILAADAIL